MKKLIPILIAIIALIVLAAPAYADDPQDGDTDVTVVVVTEGDVDLGVGINAGGNVNVTIDGTDINKALSGLTGRLNNLTIPHAGYWEWSWLQMRDVVLPNLKTLNQNTEVIANAVAILIQKSGLSDSQIKMLYDSLYRLEDDVETLTWMLDTVLAKTDEQQEMLAGVKALLNQQASRIDTLSSQLETLNERNKALEDEIHSGVLYRTKVFFGKAGDAVKNGLDNQVVCGIIAAGIVVGLVAYFVARHTAKRTS